MSYRGQHNHTKGNKKFVELYENLSTKYRDVVLAKKLNIPTSSFSKIKLGYFYADNDILKSMKKLAQLEARPSILNIKESKRPGKTVFASTQKTESGVGAVDVLNGVDKSVTINIPQNFSGVITINVK